MVLIIWESKEKQREIQLHFFFGSHLLIEQEEKTVLTVENRGSGVISGKPDVS